MSSDSTTVKRGNGVIPVIPERSGSGPDRRREGHEPGESRQAGHGQIEHGQTDPGQLMRASVYEMLAALLAKAPSADLIGRLAALDAIDTSEGSLAMGWELLRQASLKEEERRIAANQADHETLKEEYFNLFIGVGRGELVPFGSWYITGFLMEKPLSLLRTDLAALDIQRQEGVAESEDHVAALCDAMALIIRSGDATDFSRQQAFFKDHLAPWAGRFFNDLQNASGAGFYRAVGFFGENYIEFEQQYFDMQT